MTVRFFMKLTLMLLIIFSALTVFASDKIGSFKQVKGETNIERGSETISAEPGGDIFQGDFIKTGADSSAGMIFADGTTFSIGENSEIVMNKYVFVPTEEKYGFDMDMNKGTAVYESGRMAKLSPKSIKLNTPKATIAVRGTKFMVKVD